MGHFHTQQLRNKENYKTLYRNTNRSGILNMKHNTKHSKTPFTNRYKKVGFTN
jgi:hypothetical protein